MVTLNSSRGFTYLGLLFALALAGVAFALTGVVWHTAGKRAKEEQLLFAGSAIRDAIARYYRRSPGGNREYPRTLQDLLEDRRYITVERHLRKIYVDPISGKRDWGLIKTGDDRIVGVYSQSHEAPMKRDNFRDVQASYPDAKQYSDWKFNAAAVSTTPAVADSPATIDAPAPPKSRPRADR